MELEDPIASCGDSTRSSEPMARWFGLVFFGCFRFLQRPLDAEKKPWLSRYPRWVRTSMITYLRYPAPIVPLDAADRARPRSTGPSTPPTWRRRCRAGAGTAWCCWTRRTRMRSERAECEPRGPAKRGGTLPQRCFLFAFYRYGVPECALNMEFWNALHFWGISPCSALVGRHRLSRPALLLSQGSGSAWSKLVCRLWDAVQWHILPMRLGRRQCSVGWTEAAATSVFWDLLENTGCFLEDLIKTVVFLLVFFKAYKGIPSDKRRGIPKWLFHQASKLSITTSCSGKRTSSFSPVKQSELFGDQIAPALFVGV